MERTEKNTKRKSVNPVPDGFHTVTPFLIVDQASRLITFIEQAFNGKTTSIMETEDGQIMHATTRIGDSEIMIADAMGRSPSGTAKLYLYMDDVDSFYKQALSANGTSIREPIDEFYGDRSAGVKDPWGNEWWIATHIEDVDPKEMKKRQKEFMEKETTT
ncbi:MAG: VOC family protein [Chryseolinea sp.]